MIFARFPDSVLRPAGYQLLPYSFEELEIFPGCICAGTAHFDVDRFGDWSVYSVDLTGYHGPDLTLTENATGQAAVIFKLVSDALRQGHTDRILGNQVDPA